MNNVSTPYWINRKGYRTHPWHRFSDGPIQITEFTLPNFKVLFKRFKKRSSESCSSQFPIICHRNDRLKPFYDVILSILVGKSIPYIINPRVININNLHFFHTTFVGTSDYIWRDGRNSLWWTTSAWVLVTRHPP